jgi:hypothetical protein
MAASIIDVILGALGTSGLLYARYNTNNDLYLSAEDQQNVEIAAGASITYSVIAAIVFLL